MSYQTHSIIGITIKW